VGGQVGSAQTLTTADGDFISDNQLTSNSNVVVLGAAIAEGVSLAGVMKAVITPTSVILALGFAMAVGLFFGIAPAGSAARLDPIEALRQD
jgi:ABC-type antimicrobial peptide transport system permease subunit